MSGCDNTEEYSLTVTVDPPGGGTISPAVGTYDYDDGTEVEVTATAADGYVFDHWSGDGDLEGTANPVTITMDSDKTVTAHFDPVYDLTVDVDPVEAGEVTLSEEGPYKEDTEVTLTATPADDYVFDHWSGDGDLEGTANPVTITMDSDKTVTAHFTPVMYSLMVEVFPDYGGTVQISPLKDSYAPGTEVTLTVSLNKTTYSLTYWRMEGIIIGYENPITIIMDSDKEITAVIYCGG